MKTIVFALCVLWSVETSYGQVRTLTRAQILLYQEQARAESFWEAEDQATLKWIESLPQHDWTMTHKGKFTGKLIEVKQSRATIIRKDGEVFFVPLVKLCKADQDYIRSEIKSRKKLK